jgi:hypothetical protein
MLNAPRLSSIPPNESPSGSVVRSPFPPIAQTIVGLWNGASSQNIDIPATSENPV